jgi:ribosomal protein S18 acetylase RimI-like enzyme
MKGGDPALPDEPAGPFPEPPVTTTDREGREVTVRPIDADEIDALTEMYLDFDPADRAQGIPPTGEERIRDWLSTILDDGLNLAAVNDDGDGEAVVGHATLVPGGDDGYELAIFVLQAFQGAGIGRLLLEHLLGYGEREGVEAVWLTVERWNHAAIGLYKDVGFENTSSESFELEMALRLE